MKRAAIVWIPLVIACSPTPPPRPTVRPAAVESRNDVHAVAPPAAGPTAALFTIACAQWTTQLPEGAAVRANVPCNAFGNDAAPLGRGAGVMGGDSTTTLTFHGCDVELDAVDSARPRDPRRSAGAADAGRSEDGLSIIHPAAEDAIFTVGDATVPELNITVRRDPGSYGAPQADCEARWSELGLFVAQHARYAAAPRSPDGHAVLDFGDGGEVLELQLPDGLVARRNAGDLCGGGTSHEVTRWPNDATGPSLMITTYEEDPEEPEPRPRARLSEQLNVGGRRVRMTADSVVAQPGVTPPVCIRGIDPVQIGGPHFLWMMCNDDGSLHAMLANAHWLAR